VRLSSLSAPTNAITTLEECTAVLNHAKLRPLSPMARHRIINDLREKALASAKSTPLQEIVQALKDQYTTSNIAISKNQILDVCRALRISGMCQRGSHPNYEHDVWFLRTDIAADEMITACARLYVWVLLRETGHQHSLLQRMKTVTTILFGDDLDQNEAAQRLTILIKQLVESGNCIYDEADGVPIPRAVGEEFEVSP
jgi:hypothetical protein